MRTVIFGTYDTSMHPRIGSIAEGLAARGIDVTECNIPLGLDTAARVDMLARPWKAGGLAVRLASRWAGLARMARKAGTPDAVVVGYLGHFDVHLARLLYRRGRVPLLLDHLVSASGTAKDRRLDGGPRQRVLRLIDAAALRAADTVIVDTEEHLEQLPERYRAKGVVVHVGAPAPWHEAAHGDDAARDNEAERDREAARDREGARDHEADRDCDSRADGSSRNGRSSRAGDESGGAEDGSGNAADGSGDGRGGDGTRGGDGGRPLRVVFYGLFTPLQGTPVIGEALGRIASAPVEVTMIGRGQDEAAAKAAAAANRSVRWLDWVPAADLPAVVAGHDVCLGIFGTGEKALRVVPNKVYQGAAAGCAVITSDTAPQRRVLGDAAVLVPPGDAAALADALVRLADDRETLAKLRQAARQLAAEQFTPERIVQPLLSRLR